MTSVSIIIPVKDEELGLKFLLQDFKNSNLNSLYDISFIVIIDERTSDASKDVAIAFTDQIINQENTHGKGAAMRQAINIWKQQKTSLIVFLDADGSYSFDSVLDILTELKNGAEIVSGSRFLDANINLAGMSKLHIFGNRFLSKVSSIKNRRKISDLCTGLWGFTSEALNSLNLVSSGFDFEAELAGESRKSGYNHSEVPVKWSARKGGVSKLNSFKDGFIILLRILRT